MEESRGPLDVGSSHRICGSDRCAFGSGKLDALQAHAASETGLIPPHAT